MSIFLSRKNNQTLISTGFTKFLFMPTLTRKQSKWILISLFLIFTLTCIPQITGSLPYVFTNDEYYIVDQAMAYTTGDFSRSIHGLTHGYGDFPIVLNSFILLIEKFSFVVSEFVYQNSDLGLEKQTPDQLKSYYSRIPAIEQNYYNRFFEDPSFAFIAARSFSLVFALLCLWISYKFARIFLDRFWSLISVLLLLTIPVFYNFAGNAKIELALTFTAMASLYYLWHSLNTRKIKHIFLAALFVGLAMCSKPNASVLIIPLIYSVITISRAMHRSSKPYKNVILGSIAGLLLAFILFGPNYFYNNIVINIRQVVFQLIITGRSIPYTSYYGVILLNGIKEFGYLFSLIIISGLAIFYHQKIYDHSCKWLISLYILVLILPFVFNMHYILALYLLPVIPVFVIFGLYTLVYGLSISKVKAPYRSLALLFLIIIIVFPNISRNFTSFNRHLEAGSDTRIAAMSWIEEYISKDSRLFYLGRYTYLPPLKSRNRLAEDRRRDEKFNQSLKIHFERYLAAKSSRNFYFIKDLTGRYWYKSEFDDVLNTSYLSDHNLDYVVYSVDYFKRFDAENFQRQKSIVDNFISDLNSIATVIADFKQNPEIVNGPHIIIFRITNLSEL